MGIDYYTYVGAYLELYDVPTRTKKSCYKKCIPCDDHGSGDFCQKCGTKREHYQTEYKPDYVELLGEEYEDKLGRVYKEHCDHLERDILIENGCFPYKEMGNPTVITPATPDIHVLKFQESYKEIIGKLNALGITTIVKFGAISYWS